MDFSKITHRCDAIRIVVESIGIRVRDLVEIGVYYGDASRAFRNMWPETHLHLVDPWIRYAEYGQQGGNVWHNDAEHAYKKVVQEFGLDGHASIYRMKSEEAAAKIGKNVDVVFIDGNHSYEYVCRDINTWLPMINRPGLICGHDYAAHGDKLGVRKAVTDCIGKEHFHSGKHHGDVWFHNLQ